MSLANLVEMCVMVGWGQRAEGEEIGDWGQD